MKQLDDLVIAKEPSKIRNISMGSSEEEFIIAFNADEKNVVEYSCVFPPEKLQEIIVALFQCGISYEKEFNKDLGFQIKR